MSELISVEDFLGINEKNQFLLIDVRSEKEFEHAHIPGAVNIPLLNNEHRHLIGIEYKNKGRESAVALGFELVGPKFHEFIKEANSLTDKKDVMIYCWRGGMRSSIMSWILSMAGFKTTLLKGGYKSFRRFVLLQFQIKKKVIILGGHTGCGKTDALKTIAAKGEQVIDLEKLANHRGSAFGQLGLPKQPSNEQFENLIGLIWKNIDDKKHVWLEAESRAIGSLKIPNDIFSQLQSSPLIEMIRSKESRFQRIIDEYCVFPKEDLAECTKKLTKRLGHLRLTQALNALNEGNFNEWLEVLMEYYDKYYTHSLHDRNSKQLLSIEIPDDETMDTTAVRLIECSATMKENQFA